jgi:hypothetical protein
VAGELLDKLRAPRVRATLANDGHDEPVAVSSFFRERDRAAVVEAREVGAVGVGDDDVVREGVGHVVGEALPEGSIRLQRIVRVRLLRVEHPGLRGGSRRWGWRQQKRAVGLQRPQCAYRRGCGRVWEGWVCGGGCEV